MIRITYNNHDPETGVINVDIGTPKDARVQIVRGKAIISPPQKAWVAGVVNTNLKPNDRLEISYA